MKGIVETRFPNFINYPKSVYKYNDNSAIITIFAIKIAKTGCTSA